MTIVSDDPVVAPRGVDDLVVAATELVCFLAFAVERRDGFLVFVRKRLPSFRHHARCPDLDMPSW
jgi:hypothetical protein